METLVGATARGQLVTGVQLREALSWKPGVAAFWGSMSYLRKKNLLITKRYGNGVQVIPTASGMSIFRIEPLT